MYKIAHISDLHVSFKDNDGHGQRLVALLKDITERKCDHVVVTGDLVNNPSPEDLGFVREIFSHFGLLDINRMSVVTGNHDIYGGPPEGQNGFRFYVNCKETDLQLTLDKFIDTFRETFPSKNSFPYLKTIGNVAFVGINSIGKWSMKKNREGSNGIILSQDFSLIKDLLTSEDTKDKFKIILIHHHFNKPGADAEIHPAHSIWLKAINWKMKLYNKKKLLKLFRDNGVSMILSGHTHVNEIYNMNGVTIVNSSSSIMPLNDDQTLYYNIIAIPGADDIDSSIKVETISF